MGSYRNNNGVLSPIAGRGNISAVWQSNSVLGAKNLIPYPYFDGTSKTNNGITYTVNDDGSITANGTATASSRFYLISSVSSNMPNGNYIISDGDVGDSTSNVQVALWDGSTYTGIVYATNNGEKAFTLSDTPTRTGISIYVSVVSGATVSNLTFKPMLRLASDTDDTYQPYAMTNRELTEDVNNIRTCLKTGELPQGTDLNDVLITGDYYATTSAIVSSLSNKPSDLTAAFRLSVLNAGHSVLDGVEDTINPKTQMIFLTNNTTPAIYMRTKPYNVATWSSWYKFTGTAVS